MYSINNTHKVCFTAHAAFCAFHIFARELKRRGGPFTPAINTKNNTREIPSRHPRLPPNAAN